MIESYLIRQFSDYLSTTLGFHYHEDKVAELKADLPEISRKLGFISVEECLSTIMQNQLPPEKVNQLASIITIGETYFFRDTSLFSSLRNFILPELIRKKEKTDDKRIRILSAGCSTGEEAYSIAILLKELIPDLNNWNIVIQGVDINPRAVEAAHRAEYSKWSFRQVDQMVIDRYFKTDGAVYQLDSEIKRMVSFSIMNLVGDVYPSLVTNTTALDMVFCRNVLMYFKQDTINKVVEKLTQSLLYDGCFFVASAELPLIYNSALTRVSKNELLYFRKQSFVDAITPGKAVVKLNSRLKRRPEVKKIHPMKVINSTKDELGELNKQLEYNYLKGNYELAMKSIEKILGLEPRNSNAIFYQIKMLCNTGELSRAKELTEKLFEFDKLNTIPYILNAMILVEEGNLINALKYIDRALYLDPELFIGNYMKGNLLINSENSSRAHKFYKNALKILEQTSDEDIIPFTDGMSAMRLKEIIQLRLKT